MTDRLLELIEDRFKTQKQLADQLGVTRQSLNTVIKNGSFSMDFLIRLYHVVPDLNLNWLILGKGDKFVNENHYNLANEASAGYGSSKVLAKELKDEIIFLRDQVSFMQKLVLDASESKEAK